MKKIITYLFVFVCVFIFKNTIAQTTWIDFGNNGEVNQPPDINMISTTQYNIDFYGVNNFRKIIEDTAYDVMSLPGNFGKNIEIGFPHLPVLTFYIEVISDTPVITINSTTIDFLQNYYLVPVQESETIGETDTIPAFQKNDSVYGLNQFYPSFNVQVSLPLTCRGHKIATVVVYPIQFNPITRQIKIVKNIDLTVSNAGSLESDNDNAIFDNFLKNNVINYVSPLIPDNNLDLLILTPDIFYETLLPLKEWKEKLGIRTSIVTQTDLEALEYDWIADPEPDEIFEGIDEYIKYLYDNEGSLAPEFILLIGETDIMPTHYWYSNNQYNMFACDMYYSTMDMDNLPPGVDWLFDFPDMFVGRISSDSLRDIETIVYKSINYEKYPQLSNTDFYENVLLAAEFAGPESGEPNPNTETRYFTYTSETAAEFITNFYNINRVYITNCEDPQFYLNGTPVDPDIIFYGEENGYPAQDATPDIINYINSGCFLVTHRDHGSSGNSTNSSHPENEGWEAPFFKHSNIDELNNYNILPVMFSINCYSGWFDGSTDFNLYNDWDCFGEQLLKYQNGGVIGYIASTRLSWSGYNDELYKGLIDAIWPDFDPFFGSEISTPTYFMGSILNHGKFFMFNKYILTNGINYTYELKWWKNRRTFEQYHVLGDPTLEMWTGVPQPLYAYVDYAQQRVTVYDDDDQVIPGAKVVLQHDEDYIVMMTDANGQVWSPVLSNLDVEVSALKHNYIPWYSTKITDNIIWNAEEDIRGNIIVTSGNTLTFGSDVNIPKYARIIVENGGTLNVQSNVTVNFGNGFCGILAYGSLTCQQYSTLTLANEGEAVNKAEIELKNANLTYSYDYLSLRNCIIKGDPYSITISNSDLLYTGIQTERGNADIQSTVFDNSYIKIMNAADNNKLVNISDNCAFNGNGQFTAVGIDNYPNFNIDHCTFRGYSDAINLYNCGYGTHEQQISNCQIYDNSSSGIIVYRTTADILHNSITDNLFGIKCFDRSAVHIEGDHQQVTQQIANNGSNEVYASRGSFPQYFHWNLVQDLDNLPGDPIVKYAGTDGYFDITNNCWDDNFVSMFDLEPTLCFDWDPKWICNQGAGSGSGSSAEEIYLEARVDIENEDFTSAKTNFEQIVEEYPESEYSKAAMKELYPLEAQTTNNYSILKAYYDNDSTIQNNEELARLAGFLTNFCEIKLENWPTAITWFEDVIQNPETMEDSIFAIIDLGYTYFLMENGGLKSSYTGNLIEHKPVSVEQFEIKRDFLLSLLPGDLMSETMKESISTLKSGELLQNVPNPFSGTTQIWFKLNEESNVNLTIYDYTGKEVNVINPGLLNAGNHSVEFNSSSLSPGIYFYSLEVNGLKTDTKKMTLMR